MQILCSGVPLDYVDEGKGQVLLLVHGWQDSKLTWKPLITELSKKFRCIAVDLPNFGASAGTEKIITLADFAGVLSEFVAKLKIQDYVLVGHSMGGQIGLYGVGEGILAPRELVVVAGAGVRNQNQGKKSALRAVAKLGKHFVPDSMKASLYKRIGSDYGPDLSEVHKLIIQNVLSHDVQSEAANITIPTLLLYGQLDRETPPSFGKTLALQIHTSTFTEIQGVDHWLHQNEVQSVSHAIEEFVSA